jgi:hypothetical protein
MLGLRVWPGWVRRRAREFRGGRLGRRRSAPVGPNCCQNCCRLAVAPEPRMWRPGQRIASFDAAPRRGWLMGSGHAVATGSWRGRERRDPLARPASRLTLLDSKLESA